MMNTINPTLWTYSMFSLPLFLGFFLWMLSLSPMFLVKKF